KQSFDPSDRGNYSNKLNWLVTARSRMGLAISDTFLYIASGLAVGSVKTTTFSPFGGPAGSQYSQSKTRYGWVAGAGVEHMLTRNWTIGTEVLFMDLG